MAQRPISSKRLVTRASRATGHYGLWHEGQFGQKVGRESIFDHRLLVIMARRPIRAKVGREGIADHGNHMARIIMAQRPIRAKVGRETWWTTSKYGTKANIARHRGSPVIMGKGRNHRSSWAKGWNHWSSWAKGRSRKRLLTTSYGTKAN